MGAGMGFEPTVTEVVAYEATELTAAQTRLNMAFQERVELPT